jgi:hypothetical protein
MGAAGEASTHRPDWLIRSPLNLLVVDQMEVLVRTPCRIRPRSPCHSPPHVRRFGRTTAVTRAAEGESLRINSRFGSSKAGFQMNDL